MRILINWFLSAVAVVLAATLIPGVHVTDFLTAVIIALVLGILNAIIKPILVILTLPINILTLGLFTLVINAVLVLATAYVVPGFKVDGFLPALLFGLVLSIINTIFHKLVK